MNEELELKLVKKYPVIFQDYKGDYRKTCMAWGFSCGDGWYKIIDNLCQDIETKIGKKNIQFIAVQVKEKFGALRFYYHIDHTPSFLAEIGNSIRNFFYNHGWGVVYNKFRHIRKIFFKSTIEKISDIVESAEMKSYKTCEICGNDGKKRKGNWIRVRCDKCEEEKK